VNTQDPCAKHRLAHFRALPRQMTALGQNEQFMVGGATSENAADESVTIRFSRST
jgi:hypothetical protein